jgi:formate hydrogenlyase transcriptional activator
MWDPVDCEKSAAYLDSNAWKPFLADSRLLTSCGRWSAQGYNPLMGSAGQSSEQARQALDIRLVVDTIPTLAWSARSDGSADFFNQPWLEYTGLSAEQALNWGWRIAVHPDDLARMLETFQEAVDAGRPFEVEGRLRRSDGAFRWFLFRGNPLLDESGRVVKWYGTNTDLEERKRAEQALRANEQSLRLIVDSIPGFVCTLNAAGEVELLNRQVLDYFGKAPEELKNWAISDAVHPADLPRVIDAWRHSVETGEPYILELRQRRADGVYRWFQARALPARDAEGRINCWYMLLTDIDDRKRAEDTLRSNEQSLRLIVDSIPGFVSTANAAGEVELVNRQVLEYFGRTAEELKNWDTSDAIHPADLPRMIDAYRRAIETGQPLDVENRSRRADGVYRWFHVRGRPQRDAEGRIVRWYSLVTDIDERKRAEDELEKAFEEIKRLKDRLHDENVVLREQIDQVSMFEEIVGSSPALKAVLASIVKVAPTDSTVLITGETGTGKELIARAIHKGSERAGQAFITVNCASTPASLIASELFGHEKGAFTGALQQRRGRFELAQAGTIFLDEVGELPAETQIALLRVLQERQFERVGGNRVISADVRVIAATNRELSAAIGVGTFRADLFYRLNVFPIHVPALRQRKEDIPMLVEYFVKRYAEKAKKEITRIDRKTLKLCQAYDWPGNIRELQNIIERSVILCNGETFWVDEAWLTSSEERHQASTGILTETLEKHEKELIEAALTESKGRIAGPNGAAARLGIPRSTLDFRIKRLKIATQKFAH